MNSASGGPGSGASEPGSDGRLDSWKEIAAHLRRSVRSAKRWEKEEGLPVHRHLHGKRDSVYAYSAELDAWWNNRGASLSGPSAAEEVTAVSMEQLAEQPARIEATEPAREISPPSGTSRAAALVAAGLFATLLIAAVWVSRHNPGVAPQRAPLPFQSRDWVLVAGFENRTGQALLDGTLEYALQRELSNSRYVNVVPRERIDDALRLMRKAFDTRVDAAIGREICLRDGDIRALVTGRVEKLGSKYLLSVQLADPNRSGSVTSATAQASSEDQLLPATRRVSDEIRAMLGENPPSIQQASAKLLKVTTPSLRALQLYSQADTLIAQGKSAAAEELLKQAVAEDPEFASAHIHLAHAIRNQGRPKNEFLPAAETAFRLSATTTERERYFIQGSYYHLLGQKEKAIAAYQALLTLYPDHFWGTGNLANCFRSQGRIKDAVELEVRRADLQPRDFRMNHAAARLLAPLDRARSHFYIQRALEAVSPAVMEESPSFVAWLELAPAAEHWLDGDPEQVLQVADRLAARSDFLNGPVRQSFAEQIFPVYLELGRLDAAARSAQKIADLTLRHDYLARLAFIKDDPAELKGHLEASEEGAPLAPPRVSLLARVGLLPQAARLLAKFEKCCADQPWIQILRGDLALARGQVNKGISELEDGTRRMNEGLPYFFLGTESLATALERKGNLGRAVQVLESASARRPAAAFQYSGSYWLRSRFQLARLYRETGREQDALTIEEELGKLLALADPDHPIRRALDRHKAS